MKHEVLQYFKYLGFDLKELDELFKLLEKCIIKIFDEQHEGRPRAPLYNVAAGIFWYLRSGAPWRMIPPPIGNFRTINRWFLRCSQNKLFCNIFDLIVKERFSKAQSKLKKIIFDGTLTHAPGRSSVSAFNPRRGKRVATIMILTEGTDGFPVNIEVAGGTASEYKLVLPSLDSLISKVPLPKGFLGFGDKGHDSLEIRQGISRRGGKACIPFRNLGQEVPMLPDHHENTRYKIERTNFWIKSYRAMRWLNAKRNETLKSFASLAGSIIYMRRFGVARFKSTILRELG